MITKPINRGDIVLVNFGDNPGSVQNGYRPAVILQRNRYNKSSTTTIVAPITSVTKRTKMSSHVFIGRRFGLLEDPWSFLNRSRRSIRMRLIHASDT